MSWLCKILHLDKTVMVTACWHYYECRLCHRRAAVRRYGVGYGVVDSKWLEGKTERPTGFDIRFRDYLEGPVP